MPPARFTIGTRKGVSMRYQFALSVVVLIFLVGCEASYTAPGRSADFSKLGLTAEGVAALTDYSIQQALSKKPLVTFPASIAVVRVQAADYNSYSCDRYYNSIPRGAYSALTIRDIEKDDDFAALTKLPQVEGVAGIKRILLDKTLNSDLELRNAAARLNANLLLYYTFDTSFFTQTYIPPLTTFSLGLAPNKEARVTCTASAVLMDTRNGYIYGVMESTASNNQLATSWNSADAMDQARRATEREAFEGLIASFQKEWPNVLKNYDKSAAASRAP
jgi:hypothetical protein